MIQYMFSKNLKVLIKVFYGFIILKLCNTNVLNKRTSIIKLSSDILNFIINYFLKKIKSFLKKITM